MTTNESSNSAPRRTGHACIQCRSRKQRCGGFTYDVKCRPCTTRNISCSFEEAANDPRLNPYIRQRSSKSPGSRQIGGDDLLALPIGQAGGESGHTTYFADRISPTTHVDSGLSQQVEALRNHISNLEQRLTAIHGPNQAVNQGRTVQEETTPFMAIGPSLMMPLETIYLPPPNTLQASSGYSPLVTGAVNPSSVYGDGPLSTLSSFHPNEQEEKDLYNPIAKSICTHGEAFVMFRLYFSHCHPIAPFLDIGLDSDLDRVRSNSSLLFLAILCVGARFWSFSARTSCWLHPRYPELVHLLDSEITRITLRPTSKDAKLETVQGLILCAHWMPFDLSTSKKGYRSRFSEAGVWQCLGLAIRWATFLTLEKSCLQSFQTPATVSREDVRRYRTMLYLTESDHYLALSARRPPHLDPNPLNEVLPNYLRCNDLQPTDVRLTSLFRVACAAHITGCRPTTMESVEAFDKDVQVIESHFTSSLRDRSVDALNQHFPFTSLRWYRLSYACAFLDVAEPVQRSGKALTWGIEWAREILNHLAKASVLFRGNGYDTVLPLEPDPSAVEILSFAIDHYFVVIAYAAFFLVNVWLSNHMDLNLQRMEQVDSTIGAESNSLLYRLVDVAARTMEAASTGDGHLAQRYVPLLKGMAAVIQCGKMPSGSGGVTNDYFTQEAFPEFTGDLAEEVRALWQQAGLETIVFPTM